MDVQGDPVPEPEDSLLRRRIGSRVRAVRQTRGLTQRELAALATISVSRLNGVEKGRSLATVRSLVAIAAALDVGAGSLMEPTTLLDLAELDRDAGLPEGHWRSFVPLTLGPGLVAASSLFAELGYHGVTMQMIAERAGLSPAELRERYSDTQALLQAGFAILLDDMRSRTATALQEADGALQQFTNAVECLSLHHAYRRHLSVVAQTEMRHLEPRAHERMRAARVAEQRAVDATVMQGVAEGIFTTAHPREAARAVVAMCLGVSHWFDPDGPDSAPQVAAQQVRFALAVVGHQPAAEA